MKRANKFSPEVQQRAVRMVVEAQGRHDSQWAAIESIAAKIACTAETQRIKDLERENRELRRANEILKQASAFFAQAKLDRRLK